METGTCCWPAPPHICNYDAPGSHNRPWETKSFDLKILRGALHAEPKIKYMFTRFGSSGEGGAGGESGGGGVEEWWRWWWGSLVSCFDRVSLVFLLSRCQSQMKVALMRSWQTRRPATTRDTPTSYTHVLVITAWDSVILRDGFFFFKYTLDISQWLSASTTMKAQYYMWIILQNINKQFF